MGRDNIEKKGAARCEIYRLLSMSGGDAAFCQITLTTCYIIVVVVDVKNGRIKLPEV